MMGLNFEIPWVLFRRGGLNQGVGRVRLEDIVFVSMLEGSGFLTTARAKLDQLQQYQVKLVKQVTQASPDKLR